VNVWKKSVPIGLFMIVASGVWLIGCGNTMSAPDTGSDVGSDVGQDAAQDSGQDSGIDSGVGDTGDAGAVDGGVVDAGQDAGPFSGFIRRDGRNLVKNGQPMVLRGIALGNYVWQDVELPTSHHDEAEYAAIAAMKLNLVRFYMHYLTFEDDAAPLVYKEAGWQWLDQNIEWAKKHGIHLILNIHVPQGGFQSLGGGYDLWNKTDLQGRFVALWKAIAGRYRDEPVIAAYDILNEPTVPAGMDLAEWKALAQRTVAAIREVDGNHVIVIEPLNSIEGVDGFKLPPSKRQFAIDDPQVMYDIHFYLPFDYAFQKMTLLDFGDGGKYPDDRRSLVPYDAELGAVHYGNPPVAKGDSGWTRYEGTQWSTSDPALGAAAPLLFCSNLTGTVKFDDITVTEYDALGTLVRELIAADLTDDYGWYPFNSTGGGGLVHDTADGMGAPGSLSISNTGAGSMAVWGAAFLPFPIVPGNRYMVSGAMKGVAVNDEASCQATLGAYRSPSGEPFHLRNRDYLAYELARWLAFAKDQNAPVFIGEFGLTRFCFEDGKGGAQWLTDVLELMDENGVNAASLHQYYDAFTGLYADRGAPGTINQPLIDTLTGYFGP
jgi:endoglucanase